MAFCNLLKRKLNLEDDLGKNTLKFVESIKRDEVLFYAYSY